MHNVLYFSVEYRGAGKKPNPIDPEKTAESNPNLKTDNIRSKFRPDRPNPTQT
jgi:hypothetical protein